MRQEGVRRWKCHYLLDNCHVVRLQKAGDYKEVGIWYSREPKLERACIHCMEYRDDALESIYGQRILFIVNDQCRNRGRGSADSYRGNSSRDGSGIDIRRRT